jgi:hypothetical protein
MENQTDFAIMLKIALSTLGLGLENKSITLDIFWLG